MRYNEAGINIDSVDKLILDIYNYAERINKTLNQITDVVDKTKTIYNCDAANNYRNKFESFRVNFNIVDKNIKSYADDLIKLKNRYQNIGDKAVETIKRATNVIENRKY